ncbi:hydroxymethylglutaryl-CoA reductase [Candidatus Daviesbacteria bacterium]|nr:hydroxymethylglutaryl-CoA reductase [Candidatus Daviesbacteria bacterium]
MKNKLSLRDFPSAQKRREFLETELNIKLDNVGCFSFTEDQAVGRNIENLIGATQIPLGIAGPLLIHSSVILRESSTEGSLTNVRISNKSSTLRLRPEGLRDSSLVAQNDRTGKKYYLPLATTEGALVASASRGCKAINQSGGAEVLVEEVGVTRGPVFKVKGIREGIQIKQWIKDHFADLAKVAETTSHHLRLKKMGCRLVGRNLFARFYYDCQDAMGMNMATIATEQAVSLIEQGTEARCISIAGNFDIDKKPGWLNFISGRGKRVWAESVLKKEIVKSVLKTTPEKIAEVVYRKCQIGSAMAGSLGFNAHFANVVAAVFAATGQDLAHVAEGSLGITTAEVLTNGDLYFSIYLPSLMCGTVGGGTHLPAQQEALSIMGVKGTGDSVKYAQILGSAILAVEVSLMASLAEGSLAKAHQKLGRGQKSKIKTQK